MEQSMIEQGTAVALTSKRETMKGRVRRPPRHGKASVYWVRRRQASSVRLSNLTVISDDELVAFLDQQDAMYREAWEAISGDEDALSYGIAPPAQQSDEIKAFIRTGRDDVQD
jgi:hypothetical protein